MESLSNKAADFKTCSVIKKRLQQSCFPVNIAKSLRTCWRMHLVISYISWKIIFSRNLGTWKKMPSLIEAVLGTWTVIFPINLKLVFLLLIMLQCFMLIATGLEPRTTYFLKEHSTMFGQMVQCSFKNDVVLGSSPVAVT